MGLKTTWFTSSPLIVNKLVQSASTTQKSTTVAIFPAGAATHLSITNVSTHGHGNMAPALTEPLSQTNKLSSSATSASPRPSSNNLISDSESVSANGEGLSNSSHSSLTNSQSSPSSDTQSFVGISSGKSGQDNFLSSANKNGSFQSAFEQFQQIRQLQTSNPDPYSVRGKRRSYSNNNKLSFGRRQRNTVTSPVNGRLSNGQMGPMCDTNIKFEEHIIIENISKEKQEELEEIEDQVYPIKKPRLGDRKEAADVQTTQHMDFSNCDEIIQSSFHDDDVPTLQQSNNNNNKEQEHQHSEQHAEIVEQSVLDTSDNKCVEEQQQTVEVIQDSIQTTDVNRSDCDNFSQQLQIVDEDKTQKTPPRTLPTSSGVSNPPPTQTTPITSLTPQSTTPSGMGLQKDFIKDTAEMEQVLGELGTSDMELLQVLKGFDTTPGGEGAFCELSLFTDVDVMNYEEVGIQQPKDAETKEVRTEIERRQMQMQRKCDFLLRRLRKIQTRYMGKHTSEEIAGLFEWQANPSLRRKEPEATRSVPSYEDEKRHQISTNAIRSFLQRVEAAAKDQHVKRNKVGRPPNARLQAESSGAQTKSASVASVIPPISPKMAEEIAHVSGHLHTELKEIQIVLDSDATASSSGGESADEMQQFNNTVQQPLSISKRAAWRWLRDRSAIASRWSWLLAQISDLEYRIRQHTELHHQIKKNKGAVTFEKYPNESLSTSTPATSPMLPSSVNGYRGVLPGNSKAFDTDSPTSSTGGGIAPNGAYESTTTNSMGSCRTRAFQRAGFRKRKLLQTANVHTVSKKAARPSTVKCGCQWPLHPCGLCTGRPDPTAPRDLPDTMTPSERVALLDSGFHPVLSFPDDVSHSIHFEATMRLPEWQNRVIRCSSKTSPTQSLKGTVAVQKAAEREDRSKKFVDGRRKYTRKYPQDLMAANKLKNAKARRSLHGSDPYNNHPVKSKHRKQLVSSSSMGGASAGCGTSAGVAGLGSNNGGGLSSGASSTAGSDSMGLVDSFDTSNGQLPRSKNASPTPGSHSSSSFKSERMDRRNRNSYDIDNIVIPYSVAAATRVEILPYKEIPTPKWRIIDESSENVNFEPNENETTSDPTLTTTPSAEKTDSDMSGDRGASITDETTSKNPEEMTDASSRLEDGASDNNENEDISDETFLIRHERALIEERRKFQTYLKYPWSTRSRANRRTDSRAESSGANTPDPSSPAPNTPNAVGDQESVPSPTAPSTPQTPLDTLDESVSASQGSITTPNNQMILITANSAAKRVERKRTASGRKEREHSKDDATGNLTPDGKELIPPYEPLEFPLCDEVFEAMLQLMPNDHQLLEDCLKSNICDGNSEKALQSEIVGGISSDGKDYATTDHSLYASGIGGVSIGGHHLTVVGSNDHGSTYETELLAFGAHDNLMGGDSDTDSAESGMPDEDPNDPEWREPQ